MTDSVIKYVGVDSCPYGWIGVGLDDGGCATVEVCKDFSDIVACFKDACVILVDMPIGLCEDGKPTFRVCDKEARGLLGKRRDSVFLVPSRRFVNEVMENEEWGYRKVKKTKYDERHRKASKWSKNRYGKKISRQSFGITPKIGELDEFLAKHRGADSSAPTIREVHPEICFWALNNKHPVLTKKKKAAGLAERRRIVCGFVQGAETRLRKEVRRRKFTKALVADDDILDALVAAITARIGCENGFQTLPSYPWECSIMDICLCGFSDHPPKDSKGLPMQMVYALPNKGTPC